MSAEPLCLGGPSLANALQASLEKGMSWGGLCYWDFIGLSHCTVTGPYLSR